MNKDWWFFHADQRDAQHCMDDQEDFVIFIHLLGWNCGAKNKESENNDNE